MADQHPGTFRSLLALLFDEVIAADTDLQITQRTIWTELARGQPLAEGLDRNANLGMAKVSFVLWLSQGPRGFFGRIWAAIQRWRGRAAPPRYRLCSAQAPNAIRVEIVVDRNRAGRWQIQSEPRLEEDADVVGIVA
jgi:hypothetical protein